MKLSNIFRPRLSSLIIVAFGAFLFWTGYRIGSIEDSTIKKREEQFYNFLLTVVIPLGVGFIGWSMSQEINEASRDQIESAKRECNITLSHYKTILFDNLAEIEKRVEPLKNSGEIYRNCLEELEKCKNLASLFEKKSKVAQKITLWLNSRKNRQALMKEAVLIAQRKYHISQSALPGFQNDIGRCINWLRDSISQLNGYRVDKAKLAENISALQDGLRVYMSAIESIKFNKELSRISGDSGVLEDFVDELLSRLSN